MTVDFVYIFVVQILVNNKNSQHGKKFHKFCGTARVPALTRPVLVSAHQQTPSSHCNSSKLPFCEQCKVMSALPFCSSMFLNRLHSVHKNKIHIIRLYPNYGIFFKKTILFYF